MKYIIFIIYFFLLTKNSLSTENFYDINYLKSDNIRNSIGKNAHNLFKYNASSEIAALILKDIKSKK